MKKIGAYYLQYLHVECLCIIIGIWWGGKIVLVWVLYIYISSTQEKCGYHIASLLWSHTIYLLPFNQEAWSNRELPVVPCVSPCQEFVPFINNHRPFEDPTQQWGTLDVCVQCLQLAHQEYVTLWQHVSLSQSLTLTRQVTAIMKSPYLSFTLRYINVHMLSLQHCM